MQYYDYTILLYADPDFIELIQYRFHRDREPGIISDIYDGQEYLKHSDFFEHKFNLSFAFNFDGAPKFKSSKVQIWPIQMYLNELPPHIRYIFLCFGMYLLCLACIIKLRPHLGSLYVYTCIIMLMK